MGDAMIPTDLASYFFHQIREAEEEAGRVYEAVIGIVTNNKDPDKLARVQVKLPTLSADDTTWWAPLSALGAGKQRGWFFLPEVDDEVLVMFEHGDIGRPVIVGALWNGQDKPPDKNEGANEHRVIVSRTGSRIMFDDKDGKIIIEDGDKKGRITIDKANKILIESDTGDCCFQAPDGDLVIVAKEITMEAKMYMHVQSGSGGTDLGGDKAMTLDGGSMLNVKGQTIDLGPGGVSAPSAQSHTVEEVADPKA
jgi:uncharacterized protein involved in type VI secretion and phage assembly